MKMVQCPVCEKELIENEKMAIDCCEVFRMWPDGTFRIHEIVWRIWFDPISKEWCVRKNGVAVGKGKENNQIIPQQAKEILDRWKKLESFE